jgi:hypothetical protein
MKNKLITRFLVTVAGVVLLALSTTNAFALTNSQSVVSPFWQSDGNVYTFVAVSHTSLSGMQSTIGVIVNALQDDGSTSFGSTDFTVTQNSTTRLFIVATNHSTVNSLTVTAASDIFITGTTNLGVGQLNFTPSSSNPHTITAQGSISTDITMLNYWGSVVVPGTNTGFAMEFIGDTHDSLFVMTSSAQITSPGVN